MAQKDCCHYSKRGQNQYCSNARQVEACQMINYTSIETLALTYQLMLAYNMATWEGACEGQLSVIQRKPHTRSLKITTLHSSSTGLYHSSYSE